METSASALLVIFAAGVVAGTVNAVAGGGTLLSFPALLWLGRDPIAANVSNTVALWPGSLASAYAFRRELRPVRRLLALLLPPSVIGALMGAWLLLQTPARWFAVIVPVLILVATALIALKRPLLAALAALGAVASPARAAGGQGTGSPGRAVALVASQLIVGIYGGYFGAAMGIIMLATLGLFGVGDIHQRNALKNAVAAAINAVAAVFFAVRGAVNWRDAAVLAAGAVTGGYVGASLGRKLDPRVAEAMVVVIGLAAAVGQILRAR
jgi:uncharacterized membrane protein YfcA